MAITVTGTSSVSVAVYPGIGPPSVLTEGGEVSIVGINPFVAGNLAEVEVVGGTIEVRGKIWPSLVFGS